jgi:organic hydroperoxide reductase OsmC/OhrA
MEAHMAHHTVVRLSTTNGVARASADGQELTAGPTSSDGWQCEQLLVAAAAVSLFNSFCVRARQERLATGAFTCVAEAVFHEDASPPLGRLVLRVELEAAADDLTRAEQILHAAKERCVAARALTVPLELQITALPSGAASPSLAARWARS